MVLGQYDGYQSTPASRPTHPDAFVAARLWIDTDRAGACPSCCGPPAAGRGTARCLLLRSPVGPIAALPCRRVLAFSMFGSGEIDLSLVAKPRSDTDP